MKKVDATVRKETIYIAGWVVVLSVVMVAVFLACGAFDWTVAAGALLGSAAAVLNFFLMGLTVQKVVSTEDEGMARSQMKASYSRRMLLQMLWVVIAIAAPCFHFVAGILPLLFPSLGIKILAAAGKMK